MRANARIPSWVRGFPEQLRAAGYYCTNNAKTDYNATIDVARTWNASGPAAHWRNRPAGAPFFSVFNFMTSHEGALIPGTEQYVPGPPVTNPAAVRLPAYHPDTSVMRDDRARYYDAMARVDSEVATILQQLQADGLADVTIVFYYSDNGGALPRSKRYCFDSGLSTPLVVRFPSNWASLAPAPPGSTLMSPVSSVDLAPTVLRLAGLNPPAHMHGQPFAGPSPQPRTYSFAHRDRMSERYDLQRSVRNKDFRYVRNYNPHLIYGQHLDYAWDQPGYREWERRFRAGTLTPVQQAFWQPKPKEELYRLAGDRDEITNLATHPGYENVLNQMRTALDNHLVAVHDNGFIPEGESMEGYEQSRVPGAYPLATAMAVAALAIQRDPVNLGQLRSWLTHSNAVVRYWAALGCLMLGSAATGAESQLISRLTDKSAAVKGGAAHALCRVGRADQGVPVLANQLTTSKKARVRLRAANSLHEIGELARPALPSLERAMSDSNVDVREASTHTVAVLRGTYRP
jgi:hypothetical protein